jgi:type III secretion protein J
MLRIPQARASGSERGALFKYSRIASIMFILCLTACSKQVVYANLTEAEANEITATLLGNGVSAYKTTLGEKGSSVSVDPDNFLLAVKILRDSGLPRSSNEDLGMIFKKSGITSTPFEERVRFLYGLSRELERTINAIDGIIVARVHLVLPEQQEFGKTTTPPSASVLVKYKTGTDIEFLIPQMRRLVANAIQGLSYAAVNVTTVEAQPSSLSFRTSDTPGQPGSRTSGLSALLSDWRNLALAAVALLILLGGAAFGFFYMRKNRMMNTQKTPPASEQI